MKAQLTLLAAIAALAVGVPTALGEGRLDGAPELVDPIAYFHANELATAAASGRTIAPERFDGTLYFRANELATTALGPIAAPYVDAFERPDTASFQASPAPSVASDSGSSIAWSQIAIALGLALALALGLLAAARLRLRRPLAQ